jgi:hypothetical protein
MKKLDPVWDGISHWSSDMMNPRNLRAARVQRSKLEMLRAGEGKRTVRAQGSRLAQAVSLFVLVLAWAAPLQAQINHWINPGAGKWEVATNWALGTAPSTSDVFDNIFSGGTVTIDATTSGSFSNTMTVNYVGVESVELALDNAGTNIPLHILNELDITANGRVTVTNSALQVDGPMKAGILSSDMGSLDFYSGLAQFGSVVLGDSGSGELTVDGGTLTVVGAMTLGASPGGAGYVVMYGGTLIHTNNPIIVGGQGYGNFDMFGGSIQSLGFEFGRTAGSSGSMYFAGGNVLASQYFLIGNSVVTNPCSVIITNGTLSVTNPAQTAYVDVAQGGSLTLNGGVLQVDSLILTNGGTFTNLSGTFELVPELKVDNGGSVVIAGSSNNFDSGVLLGSSGGGTGSLTIQSNGVMNVISNFTAISGSLSMTSLVTIAGGTLSVSNGTIAIGPNGSARMTVSGGSVLANQIRLGGTGASGTLHLIAGLVRAHDFFANLIVADGGDLDGSSGTIYLGADHSSEGDLNGGSAEAGTMYIGYTAGFTGTYSQTGGTMVVSTNVIVGDCASGALGIPTLTGGAMYVTNATGTAVLDVRNGTFVLGSGATLVVDNLILTNACGHFVKAGGTLTVNRSMQLDPNLDADGDGESNAAEAQAGTDPLDPTSVFQLTNVNAAGRDVQLTWASVGGHSYVVQMATRVASGQPSGFVDVSPAVPASGPGPGTTSWVHTGALNNHAMAFYRVRLGP